MKLLSLATMIIYCFILTGCWDRTEVNDLAFVTTTGIDKEAENRILVSIQTPLPSAMGGPSGGGGGTSGNMPFYVDSGIGRNVREADDDLQRRMSRKLFFAHRRVVILGEELARDGMKKTLDNILEHPESRLSTFVLISQGAAIDILTSSPHFEQIPGEAVRELTKAGLHINTKNVLNDIHLPGKDPVIPVIKTVSTQNKGHDKKKELQIDMAAIMKDDVLQFIAKDAEALGASWLLDMMRKKKITVPVEEGMELNLNIDQYKINTAFKVKNHLPEFTINLKVQTVLLQNEANLNFEFQEVYEMATTKVEKEIKKQVESFLNHANAEGVDPFGLGWHIYRNDNILWENEFSNSWRELLPDIKVNIKVTADINQINNRGIKVKGAN